MIFAFFITSCSKEDVSTPADAEQQKEISIVYKGVSYTTVLNDKDELIKTHLTEEIISALNTANVFELEEDNKVYLFDTTEELDAFLDELDPKEIRSKIPVGTTRTAFFIHSHYRSGSGGAITPRISLDNNFAVAELRDIQRANNRTPWHDRISSLHITNSLNTYFYVRLYEHRNYGGRTLTFRVPRHTVKFVPNLLTYNFNDITSGIRGWY
ncbi:hypothetical protein [Kordia antarctica]|nr:hypothetical protein [Kordia antarctica]